MSASKEPNPEERERMVNEVVNKFMSSAFKQGAQDELTQLVLKRNAIRKEVEDILKPVIDAALLRSTLDPEHPHTPTGKARLLIRSHGLYIDRLKSFSRDEALMLLALIYAELSVNEFV